MATSGTKSLLDLPSEIRVRIFQHVFRSDPHFETRPQICLSHFWRTDEATGCESADKTMGQGIYRNSNTDYGITSVCKLLRHEAFSELLQSITLVCKPCGSNGDWSTYCLKPHFLRSIQHVHILYSEDLPIFNFGALPDMRTVLFEMDWCYHDFIKVTLDLDQVRECLEAGSMVEYVATVQQAVIKACEDRGWNAMGSVLEEDRWFSCEWAGTLNVYVENGGVSHYWNYEPIRFDWDTLQFVDDLNMRDFTLADQTAMYTEQLQMIVAQEDNRSVEELGNHKDHWDDEDGESVDEE